MHGVHERKSSEKQTNRKEKKDLLWGEDHKNAGGKKRGKVTKIRKGGFPRRRGRGVLNTSRKGISGEQNGLSLGERTLGAVILRGKEILMGSGSMKYMHDNIS